MPALETFWHRQASAFLQHTRAGASRSRPSLTHTPHTHNPATRIRTRRFQSTNNSSPPPSPPPTQQTHRISRILTSASRFLPKRLQTSLQNLRSAPLSHIGAFLVLHEITAILPIFGLTYAFYALDWVPTSWVLGPWAAWAEDGLKKYVPYFRKKHWFGLESKDGKGGADGEEVLEDELREEARRELEREGREDKKGWFAQLSRKRRDSDTKADDSTSTEEGGSPGGEKKTAAVWRKVKQAATADNTEKGYKIGIQIAAAYTITKLLLVPRIALSLWLTPWLARGFVGFRRAVRRKRS
ncbi:hypothetical protein GGR51DRAFT_533789 [Nemania sp. FL0031]|nr:hypothetical protein GGR51DRAFT_533789 [Nemania sp. FL0031]